jgi:hypothetical protein
MPFLTISLLQFHSKDCMKLWQKRRSIETSAATTASIETVHCFQTNTMRSAVLFLSRFLVTLWLILASAFFYLLVSESPSLPNTPFAGISIRTDQSAIVQLPNRIFTCTETDQQFRCTTTLAKRPLELSWTKGQDYIYSLGNCQAIYANRSIDCQETGMDYVRGLQSYYTLSGNLDLSAQQLQALRQQYWGINTLKQLGELRLLWMITGLSLVAGFSVALFTWFHPSPFTKILASLVCGYGIYRMVWHGLARVPYDQITPYGLTPDGWDQIVAIVPLMAATAVGLSLMVLLRGRCNRFTKMLVSFSSALGVFSLCWAGLEFSFLSLGALVTTEGNIPIWLPAAMAIVPAGSTAVWLWRRTPESVKAFLCLSSGFGAFAIVNVFLLFSLLGLGYVD